MSMNKVVYIAASLISTVYDTMHKIFDQRYSGVHMPTVEISIIGITVIYSAIMYITTKYIKSSSEFDLILEKMDFIYNAEERINELEEKVEMLQNIVNKNTSVPSTEIPKGVYGGVHGGYLPVTPTSTQKLLEEYDEYALKMQADEVAITQTPTPTHLQCHIEASTKDSAGHSRSGITDPIFQAWSKSRIDKYKAENSTMKATELRSKMYIDWKKETDS